MKTYEYEFPLKHPKYIISDIEYMEFEDKVLCRNRPIRKFFRKIESLLLLLKYRGIKGMFNKLKKRKAKKKKMEN